MKESVNRTLFFISLLLSRTIVTENPIDVHPYSTLLNFFPALSAILANKRSRGSSLKFTYSFSCLITACAATAATAEDVVCDGQHHVFYLFLANDLLFTQSSV